MSKLAAVKEHAFMKALYSAGFPVPEPLAQSRHTIVMQLIDAFPLRQITTVPDPAGLYAELIGLILRFAGVGLIHGDFNEFNILIREDKARDEETGRERVVLTPSVIDFPQTLSVDHPNAEMYFDRDVACIKRYFQRRYHFTADEKGPSFAEARRQLEEVAKGEGGRRLDVEVEATGFSRKMARELEKYMKDVGVDGDGERGNEGGEEARSGDEGGEEEDDEAGMEKEGGQEAVEPQEDLSEGDEDVVRDRLGNWVRRSTLHSTSEASEMSGTLIEEPGEVKFDR